MKTISIGKRKIGEGYPAFIIAEAGSNFKISEEPKTNYEHALKLIDLAKEANADAIKFQLYKAEKLYVENAGCADYIGKKKPIYQIIKEMELPYEWLQKLKKHCDEKNIIFLCAPFDERSADELEKIGIEAYKIASYAITHTPLLKHIAKKGKPILLSTGASNLEDIRKAVKTIKEQGNDQIALMQCTAKYPAPLSTINLKIIPNLIKEFEVPVGLSDHSREPLIAPLGAVALGAKIIEKHFTTDNKLPGPDHGFAILPEELKEIAKNVKMLEEALGKEDKKVIEEEKELYDFARVYIYTTKDMKKGDTFTTENIAVLRPGKAEKGLEPEKYEKIIGKKAATELKKGQPLKEENIEPENKITFRPATQKDSKFLFELRNDPSVRKKSATTHEIKWEEHDAWLTKSLKMPDRHLFIIKLGEKEIGQIRFDKETDSNTAEVSIALYSEHRGKGIGSQVLKEGCNFAFTKFKYDTLSARIKKENTASIKAFEKNGFTEKEQKEDSIITELKNPYAKN